MEIYIDKEFIQNFWSVNTDKKLLEDFQNNFLKKTNACTIICNYQSIDDIQACDEGFLFFEMIFEDIPNMMFQPHLKDEEVLTNCLSNGGIKIFLMEYDENTIEDFENTFGYQFISSSNLLAKWQEHVSHKSIKKTICLPVDRNDNDVFNSWNDLGFIKNTPLNSIIIADNYILSNKSKQRLEDNLIPLLEQLLPGKSTGTVSVVIFSKDILTTEETSTTKERAKKVHTLLNRYFAKFKDLKIRFSIIQYDEYFLDERSPKIHDRHIYTNYYNLKSGVGFNLFDKKERKISNSEVIIDFNFQSFYMKTLPVELNALKQLITNMQRKEKFNAFKMYPENLDKFNCPLLN